MTAAPPGQPAALVLTADPAGLLVLNMAPPTMTRDVARAVGAAVARFGRTGEVRPPTRVTSVRGLTAAEAAARGVVYVGRVHRERHGLGAGRTIFPASPLANPFVIPRGAAAATRREAVARYRDLIRGRPDLAAAARALRGRLLGCWCGEWDGDGDPPPGLHCHAVEIALLAEDGG